MYIIKDRRNVVRGYCNTLEEAQEFIVGRKGFIIVGEEPMPELEVEELPWYSSIFKNYARDI